LRKINELKAAEFPEVDPIKFAQWKVLRLKGEKTMLYLIIGISAFLLLLGAQGAIGYFVIAILIVLTPIIARKIGLGAADRHAAEIGLRENDIRAALKRQDSNKEMR